MRVIAGTAKGVRLAPVPRGVRPVSDTAREGLFASIAAEVPGARVLDLYAGTGALAIEALSRGAASAVLVERDPAALRAIRANLERTRLVDRASVMASDVARFVRRDNKSAEPFDLCLLDPPYDTADAELEPVLGRLASGWAAPGGIIVLTRSKRSSIPVIPLNWLVARRLEYGDTLVVVCREV